MKKIILSLSFLTIALTIFSQSFVLTDTSGNKITNSSIIVQDSDDNSILAVHVHVTNVTGSDVSIKVKKYALDVLEGSSDIFCWFECYGPMVTDSPDPIQAAPGETLTDFIGDYYFNDNFHFNSWILCFIEICRFQVSFTCLSNILYHFIICSKMDYRKNPL